MSADNVVVVGGGSWGTAFADLIARESGSVTLLARDPAQAAAITTQRVNERYLPGHRLHDRVRVAPLGDGSALAAADMLVIAAPSRAAGELAQLVGGRCRSDVGVLNLTKGLDPGTGRPLSETWRAACHADASFCVLSGPNHAEEIARGFPAAAVVGGDRPLAERVQALVGGERLRLYVNDDLVGLELCSAAKNVVALAAGMSDGLGFGDNTKASLMTRGLAEMTRLGLAHGARMETFLGLAGMGDLVATCTSRHSRNRHAGVLLAQGVPPDEIEGRLGQVAEGLLTVGNLLGFAAEVSVELPICEEVDAVVRHGRSVAESMRALMTRSPSAE